jgi:hypothetical protein
MAQGKLLNSHVINILPKKVSGYRSHYQRGENLPKSEYVHRT